MVGIVAVAFVAVGSMMAGRLGWLRQSVDGLQATKGLISIAERWCDCVFFFQAEDGIRDHCVTGVQTCALPIYVSRDRGASWQKFMTGLPVVPVHDLKIHPREHELIAATHGRGIWIVDVAPLEQLADSVLSASAYLFEPKTAYEYGEAVRANASGGHKQFISPRPQCGIETVHPLTVGDRRTPTQCRSRDF